MLLRLLKVVAVPLLLPVLLLVFTAYAAGLLVATVAYYIGTGKDLFAELDI